MLKGQFFKVCFRLRKWKKVVSFHITSFLAAFSYLNKKRCQQEQEHAHAHADAEVMYRILRIGCPIALSNSIESI